MKKRPGLRPAALAALALAATALAGAESPYPVTELFPVEPGINAERGFAVAVDGDWLAMGEPRDDDEKKDAGAVYLFHWSGTTWDQEAKLFADPPQPNAQLGFTLAMRNGVVAAGAPGEGAVYIFAQQDGVWVQEKRLTATGHGFRTFGRALALDEDRLAVGAVGVHGATDGAVYLYDKDSWDLEQMVHPMARQKGERFGSAVSLAGNFLVVGAPGYDVGSSPPADDAGAVYVFQRGPVRWREKAKLLPPDSPSLAGQQFGSAVATDGTHLFVGAPTADAEDATNSGAVYGFVRSDSRWDPQALPDVELDLGDQFGASLALSEDLLVAGAPAPPPGRGTGEIHVLRRDSASWEEVGLVPGNTEVRDLAGFAVAVDGERVVVGGVLGDQGDGAAGAAWSFACPPPPPLPLLSDCEEEAEAVARDPAAGKEVGASVAVTDKYLAVGAPGDGGVSEGAVYIYRRAGRGWRQEARFTASELDERFDEAPVGLGRAVALDGETLAVGAPAALPPDNGAVYMFRLSGNTWAPLARIDPFTPGETFGASIALAGGFLAVGEPGNDAGLNDAGAVHLFELRNGFPTQTDFAFLAAASRMAGAHFGSAVSLRGDTLAVGAPDMNQGRGAVYDFRRHDALDWRQEAPPLLPCPCDPPGAFGTSVSLGDGTVAIGAPDHHGGFGAVFVFEKAGSSWQRPQQLILDPNRRLGASVALLGDRLVAGAPGQELIFPNDVDHAFVFERRDGVWVAVADLDALQPPHGDKFGSAVDLSKDFIVVASPGLARGDRVTVFALPDATGGSQ